MKIKGIFLLLFLFCLTGSCLLAQTSSSLNLNKTRESSFFEDKVLEPRSDVKLFPNPAVDYLIVEIKDSAMLAVDFELNNIIGSTFSLRSEKMEGNRYKFYVKDLMPGYYFLTVKDANSGYKRAYRFVKK
jgi:hypothetical protein